ncbi:neutral cholesterol ester hydrolase 1-like isoform X2 [Denticeps clupeoides]|uniref:Neutral cholesterol ester hydrolase 1 n=1 Tax=Denticeps clupeoides TaxID=299321 RepID=A0AAY4EVX2_9TELE|nr:neutral cholesterol ester hydrolase 1 isoform X2 [Denticeps clupeoides]
MRPLPAAAAALLLSVAAAYYVYVPLPSSLAEPWKLMVLDAVFRTFLHVGNLAQDLGISHYVHVVNYIVSQVEIKGPRSSETVRVTDTSLAGVQARVFEPKGMDRRLRRAVVYFHGGGWALGSGKMRSFDLLCRRMAEELHAVIVSVDYRLVPEVHFPEQYYDALNASQHFLKPEVLAQYSVDPERVAISGDSAGGNLAAAVAQQMATDNSSSVKFKVQALIYPVLQALDFNTPSYQQNGDTPILYRSLMVLFWLEYLNGDTSFASSLLANNHTALDPGRLDAVETMAKVNWTRLLPPALRKHYKPVAPARGAPRIVDELPALLDARAAPLLAEQAVLRATPPAYIMTCEHDVLRDDGFMYGRRLEEAGVPVTHDHYEDGFHACMVFSVWPAKFSVGTRSLKNYIRWLDRNL